MPSQSKSGARLALWDDTWRATLQTVGKDLWAATDRVTDEETDRVPLRDDEQTALQPLLDLGFEIVGTGLGRVVLRFPVTSDHSEFVVKLARFGEGLLEIGLYQNRVEVETWLADGSPSDVLLGPIAWGESPNHCRWVIYPYGTPVTDTEHTEASKEELVEQVEEVIQEQDCSVTLREITGKNVVLVDGVPKLADYGRCDPPDAWCPY